MKKPVLFIFILLMIIVGLSIVKTYVSNNIATSGVILGKTQEDINKLKTENAIIAQKLYEVSSLTSVSQRASEFGYVDGKTSFVLNTKLPIAVRQ